MGAVVHTVVAPIDRAKLLLQTRESNAALLGRRRRRRRFRGMVDCITRSVRKDGVLSLWRGNGTSVLCYYPSVALNFSLKVIVIEEMTKKVAITQRLLKDPYRAMLKGGEVSSRWPFDLSRSCQPNFMAAGCTTLAVIYPLGIAHTRLAADIGRGLTPGNSRASATCSRQSATKMASGASIKAYLPRSMG